jgi:hypothetical protein
MIALRVGERAGESVVDQLMAAIGSHRVLVSSTIAITCSIPAPSSSRRCCSAARV